MCVVMYILKPPDWQRALSLRPSVIPRYKLDEWRSQWAKPAKGRAAVIALLEAAPEATAVATAESEPI